MPEDCNFKRHRRERSGEGRHRGEHCAHDEHARSERHHRRQRSSWLETFATYMNEFANLAGDIDIEGGNCPAKPNVKQQPKKQQNKPQEQAKTAAENAQAHDQPQPSTSTTNTGMPTKSIPNNINNIVRLIELCAMKSNMAVNASAVSNDASVNTNDVATNNASVNTNDVATNNASVNTNDVDMTQDDKADKDSDADKMSIYSAASSASAASKRDESPDKVGDWTVINKENGLFLSSFIYEVCHINLLTL